MTTKQLSETERLELIRQVAVDAGLEAERLEKEARTARRRATAKYKAYEDALRQQQCAS